MGKLTEKQLKVSAKGRQKNKDKWLGLWYIYLFENNKNGKIYVGQSNNPSLRYYQHKSASLSDKPKDFDYALKKYGIENFTYTIVLSVATREEVNQEEIYWIARMRETLGRQNVYNKRNGGDGNDWDEESRQKLSASLKKHYEEHESPRKGIPLTEEWKKNISEASMGKPGTNTGKTFNDKWILSISKAQSGIENKKLHRFTDEEEIEICRQYIENKKSTYALGKKMSCQGSTIINILNRRGIKKRESNYTGHSNNRNIFTAEQELEICKLYEQGNITRAALARKFNCGKTTIRDILLRHNVKL